jgi:hypothetical protein
MDEAQRLYRIARRYTDSINENKPPLPSVPEWIKEHDSLSVMWNNYLKGTKGVYPNNSWGTYMKHMYENGKSISIIK